MIKRANRFVFIIFTFALIFSISSVSAQSNIKENNYETIYSDDICTTQIYSYEKYFFRNDQWEEINNNWYDCSSEGRTKYCTNDYYFNVIADD